MPRRVTLPFEGKTALVTGASRGIGRALAVAWARAGGNVTLVGRNQDALEEVASEISAYTARTEILTVDLAEPAELLRIPQRVRSKLARLDALLHAAGHYATGPETVDDVDEFDAAWRVNVQAPLVLSHACLDLLRESGGEIVFVNSSIVNSPAATQTAYAATKRALAGIADSLRARVNADGIRVLSIYPGRTATPMQQAIFAEEGRRYKPERLLQPEDVAATVLHAMALPRTAEVTDLHIRPFLKFD